MQALASRRALGTCAKTVFYCERHELCAAPVNVLLSITHLILHNPEASRNPLPFPAWDARDHWSKIPFTTLERFRSQEHWTHLRPTISWNPSLSGTGLPTSSRRALTFRGGIVAVLFAPSHPAPLPQSPSAPQKPHFPRPPRPNTGTLFSAVPPRGRHHVWLAPGACTSPTH
jgi:hypothetical protein